MPVKPTNDLTRRERQIMEVIHARGELTAAGVRAALTDGLSDSAVRTFLRILERKGRLRHREEGGRYLYRSTESPARAKKTALRRVLDTFFGGSLASAAQTLVESEGERMSEQEIARLEALIRETKQRQRSLNPKTKP
jgi:BlaI family transcriptional regulator, penicillinase repressor